MSGLREALERIANRAEAFEEAGMDMRPSSAAVIAKIARDALARSNNGRLCTGCSQYLPPERFEKAHPDFPTRDGYNFKCKGCATPYRLERDPETKKVRAKQ